MSGSISDWLSDKIFGLWGVCVTAVQRINRKRTSSGQELSPEEVLKTLLLLRLVSAAHFKNPHPSQSLCPVMQHARTVQIQVVVSSRPIDQAIKDFSTGLFAFQSNFFLLIELIYDHAFVRNHLALDALGKQKCCQFTC